MRFWQAEMLFSEKKYQASKDLFLKMIQDYPRGNKVPDAILRVAVIDRMLKDEDHMNQMIGVLIDSYPDSAAIKRASELFNI